jgi:integrase
MARKRTGAVKWNGTQWVARIRTNDGHRVPVKFPPEVSETKARILARQLSEQAKRGELVYDPEHKTPEETVAHFAERCHSIRDAREMPSARVDYSYLRIHVLPRLGARAMNRVTADDMRDLVERLDAMVDAEKISAKTAQNIWGATRKMFNDATGSKRKDLRILSVSPVAGVEGPDRGVEKLMGYLYPVEFIALVSCKVVPLQARRWYAVQTCLYLRPGECEVLACEDVDLQHWIAHVHRSREWGTGRIKEIKTKQDRRVPIEPAVRPLIAALCKEARGIGPLFPQLPFGPKPSTELRANLRLAQVAREALYASDGTRRPLRLYHLRATGITWQAVRGDDPMKIMRRAGHADFKTTTGYIREAEILRETFGQVFPELPVDLIGSGNGFASTPPVSQPTGTSIESSAEAVGFEPTDGLLHQRLSKPPP